MSNSGEFGLLLGPLLGFLFTLGTVVFVALFAHKTDRPAIAAQWQTVSEPTAAAGDKDNSLEPPAVPPAPLP